MSEKNLTDYPYDETGLTELPEADSYELDIIETESLHEKAVFLAGQLREFRAASTLEEQQEIQERIGNVTDAQDYAESLASDECSDDDVDTFINTLADVREETNLNAYSLLGWLPAEKVQDAYQRYPGSIDYLLGMAVKHDTNWRDEDRSNTSSEFTSLVFTYSHIATPEHGLPFVWRQEGQPKEALPDYVQELVADEDFPKEALRYIQWNREKNGVPETAIEQMNRLRNTERNILERLCNIPPEIAKETRRAIEKRTLKTDKQGVPLPMSDPDAGIDVNVLHTTLTAIAETASRFSPEELEELYHKTGIVNYDRYTAAQLDLTLNVLKGDPETVANLKSGDVTLVMSDAFGDYNNALGTTGAVFDDERTLFTEITNPVSFYRGIAQLSRRGIRPSTLVVNTHGAPGYLGFGGQQDTFGVGVWRDDGKKGNAQVINVRDTQFGLLARKYMQPHTETGERHVVMAACSQATSDIHIGRNIPDELISLTDYKDKKTKVAELDKVVIKAADRPVGLIRDETQQIRYIDSENPKKEIPVYEFRVPTSSIKKLRRHADKTISNKSLVQG